VNAIKSLKKKKNKLCFTRIEFFWQAIES
jgi:hypothetical protein